jgi:hypothetical protein
MFAERQVSPRQPILPIKCTCHLPNTIVEPNRKQAVIAIVAAILAARKLATVPQNSPAYVAAIADAVADARRIVDRVEKSFQP